MIKVTAGAAKDKELYAGTPTWNRLAIGDEVHSSYLKIHIIIYLPAFLDTGLPRGNVHERDSGPMRGAIPTQSHNP